MADELLAEVAPLLAEEGIDLAGGHVPDLESLQAAMNRAIERRNMIRFTPIGQDREHAVVLLRLAVEAITQADTRLAAVILDGAEPESPDGSVATVAACIGVALGLLDNWLPGREAQTPVGLGDQARLPAGHWLGERAATDILVLARKGRAFGALDTLIARQGGRHVLYGSALAVAAAVRCWSQITGTTVTELTRTHIR